MIPVYYQGIGLGARNSNVDKDIRDYFCQSKVIILLLGKGEEWRGISDHWPIPELEIAVSMGIACFIYTTTEIMEEEVENLGLPVKTVIINDEDHFATTLKQNLSQLIITT